MAADSNTITVTTTPTLLNSVAGDADGIWGKAGVIHNDGAVDVRLGGPNVSTTGAKKGYPLAPGADLAFETTSSTDLIYGIVAAGTCPVIVFEMGV